jgi:hypothetical protein
MFVVKRLLKRGFIRDRVLVSATKDTLLARKRLGWDSLHAPDLKMEELTISKGAELIVSLPRNSVREGQSISVDDVTAMSAFNRLWKRAAA